MVSAKVELAAGCEYMRLQRSLATRSGAAVGKSRPLRRERGENSRLLRAMANRTDQIKMQPK